MITTNTGAKKLESSDNWREIFPNSTLGTAGAHNASVDAADRIQPEIAPIINGKQCALGAAKDDYVLLRNSTITGKSDGAYIAAKAIPANTDIDSTYLGNAITGGISNSINSNIASLMQHTIGTSVSLTLGVDFTCPDDGYIVINAQGNTYIQLSMFIGATAIPLSLVYNNTTYSNSDFVPCYVRKGMVIQANGAGGTATFYSLT